MCCSAACVIMAVSWVAVGLFIGVLSKCSVKAVQLALLRLNFVTLLGGAVECCMVMCMGRWSEQRGSGDVFHVV